MKRPPPPTPIPGEIVQKLKVKGLIANLDDTYKLIYRYTYPAPDAFPQMM